MKRFGLIGRTLKHSFSKNFFTEKFGRLGLGGLVYDNFELASIEEFPNLLSATPGLAGLNVTIPYKEEILPYLTQLDPVVAEIGACNCIKIEGGVLTGYNTDVVGFRSSLEPKLKPHHTQALILGTGGAAKAIQYVLRQLGIRYKMVSRHKSDESLVYEELDSNLLSAYPLIINTTPLGMFPKTEAAPNIPYQALTPANFLFDIIYNPEKTQFLAEAEKQGAQVCNGYEMLIGQAEESWRIWTEEGNRQKG